MKNGQNNDAIQEICKVKGYLKKYQSFIEDDNETSLIDEYNKFYQDVQFNTIILLQQNQMFDDAIELCNKLLKKNININENQIYTRLGLLHSAKHEYKQAISFLEKVLDNTSCSNKTRAEISFFIAKNYMSLNDLDQAEEYFNESKHFIPKIKACYNIMLCDSSKKKKDELKSIFIELLSIKENSE